MSMCVVIPVVPSTGRAGDAEDIAPSLEETLVSVLENRPDHCEIIVVLGCEYADPWNIREEVRFLRAPKGSTLAACVNLGISANGAAVVHVLCPGWRATPGWMESAWTHFASPEVGAVVPVAVSEKDRSVPVSAGIRVLPGGRRIECRPGTNPGSLEAVVADGPQLCAGFWRSEVFSIDGPGFSSTCGDGLADADLAVTARAAGWRCVVEPESRVVAPAQSQRRSGSLLAGLHAERFFWRSRNGQPLLLPLALHLLEVTRHAIAVAPWGTLPMLLGRLLALTQFGSYATRARRLQQVRETLMREGRSDGAIEPDDRPTILRLDGPHDEPAIPHAIRRADRFRKSA